MIKDGYFSEEEMPSGIAALISQIGNLETLLVAMRMDGVPMIVYVPAAHLVVVPKVWMEEVKQAVLAEWESRKNPN